MEGGSQVERPRESPGPVQIQLTEQHIHNAITELLSDVISTTSHFPNSRHLSPSELSNVPVQIDLQHTVEHSAQYLIVRATIGNNVFAHRFMLLGEGRVALDPRFSYRNMPDEMTPGPRVQHSFRTRDQPPTSPQLPLTEFVAFAADSQQQLQQLIRERLGENPPPYRIDEGTTRVGTDFRGLDLFFAIPRLRTP